MLSKQEIVCPQLRAAAAGEPVRTAVASANSALAMESAMLASESGLIGPVLFGSPQAIGHHAGRIGWEVWPFAVLPVGRPRRRRGRRRADADHVDKLGRRAGLTARLGRLGVIAAHGRAAGRPSADGTTAPALDQPRDS